MEVEFFKWNNTPLIFSSMRSENSVLHQPTNVKFLEEIVKHFTIDRAEITTKTDYVSRSLRSDSHIHDSLQLIISIEISNDHWCIQQILFRKYLLCSQPIDNWYHKNTRRKCEELPKIKHQYCWDIFLDSRNLYIISVRSMASPTSSTPNNNPWQENTICRSTHLEQIEYLWRHRLLQNFDRSHRYSERPFIMESVSARGHSPRYWVIHEPWFWFLSVFSLFFNKTIMFSSDQKVGSIEYFISG